MCDSGAFGVEDSTMIYGSTAFLVGADIKQNKYKTLRSFWTLEDSLAELRRLCETAGLEVLGEESQNMQHPNPSTFIGQGKLEEVAAAVEALKVETVIFDDELSPAQQRNIQAGLGGNVQVIDRTMLILQIFAQRARTREAKLQVRAARMRYMLPRLQTFMTTGAGMDAKGGGSSSGGGGQFLKGSGESQLESDRRLFRKQISKIEAEMDEVRVQREQYRAKRKKRDNLPIVAIVGYTNAGKSSLLNKLCGSEQVYADNLLFATLDPTVRKFNLPSGKELLLSDTVGFIQKLPTKLVPAFRATLEEVEDADVVLHVVDAASPLAKQQVWSVQNIIHELNASSTPQILVLNKADKYLELHNRLPDPAELNKVHDALTPRYTVVTAARLGKGLRKLMQVVERVLLESASKATLLIPYSAGDALAQVHKVGTVVEEEFEVSGTRVVAYLPRSLLNKLERYTLRPEQETAAAKAQ